MVRDYQSKSETTEKNASLPQAQIASLEIFNRMRVVKTLITNKDVVDKLQEKERERKTIIKSSATNVTNHTLFTDTPWNIPYDLSEVVIADGQKWFQFLNESLEGDFTSIPKYIEEFERKLLSITEESDLTIPFEELIVSLVTEQTHSHVLINDGVPTSFLDNSITNHQKFTNCIVGLAPEFIRIYKESTLINF